MWRRSQASARGWKTPMTCDVVRSQHTVASYRSLIRLRLVVVAHDAWRSRHPPGAPLPGKYAGRLLKIVLGVRAACFPRGRDDDDHDLAALTASHRLWLAGNVSATVLPGKAVPVI